jgi:ABC-type uncharacterized transport system permease subunit
LIELNFIIAALYTAAAIGAWRDERRTTAEAGTTPSTTWPHVLLWLAIAGHAVTLWFALFADGKSGINMGFSHAISLIAWLTLVSYVVLGRDVRLTRLAAQWLAPAAALAVLLVLLVPPKRVVEFGEANIAFVAHVTVGILAYALYTVAALHAILILLLQKRLHSGDVGTTYAALPPLMRMETLMFQLLWLGFAMLSITLLSGVFFSEALFGKPFQVNHKTVFAAMSWFVFGGLLGGRFFAGWRGALAVRWTLIGFVMLLLSYVGSKFVLEIILQRV